jgi:hypothetical protein
MTLAAKTLLMFKQPAMWSFLPALPLRGVETPLVESLQHYVYRQSWVTGYSAHNLVAMAKRHAERSVDHEVRSKSDQQDASVARVLAFERLTGVPYLRCGTPWWLSEVAHVSMRFSASDVSRRWCPVCYEKWDDSSSWEPLLWSVAAISNCPTHGCVLEDRCRQCGSKQGGLRKYETRRNCGKCGCSLGGEGKFVKQPTFVAWVDRQACDLVRMCATPASEPLASGTLDCFIKSLGKETYVHQEIKEFVQIHQKTKTGVGTSRPTIRTMINFCAMRGVAIEDLLLRPSEACSAPLIDPLNGFKWVASPTSSSDYKSEAVCWLMRKLMHACEQRYLPSIGCILKDIRINRAVLREYNRQLYEHYEAKHCSQASPAQMDRFAKGFNIAKAYLENTHIKLLKHHIQWVLPNKVEHEANLSFEDVSFVCWAAIVYMRLLPRAKQHADGSKRVKIRPVAAFWNGLTLEP